MNTTDNKRKQYVSPAFDYWPSEALDQIEAKMSGGGGVSTSVISIVYSTLNRFPAFVLAAGTYNPNGSTIIAQMGTPPNALKYFLTIYGMQGFIYFLNSYIRPMLNVPVPINRPTANVIEGTNNAITNIGIWTQVRQQRMNGIEAWFQYHPSEAKLHLKNGLIEGDIVKLGYPVIPTYTNVPGGISPSWTLLNETSIEAVYSTEGDRIKNAGYPENTLITDPEIIGTYNFSTPSTPWGYVNHLFIDVIPWVQYGTGPNDTSTLFDRLAKFLG
jgi:hypothetical protein